LTERLKIVIIEDSGYAIGVRTIAWSDYMLMAAQHSKANAGHWFRYLRKDIDRCGELFSQEDVEALSRNEALTPFQRVSIKAAFEEGSPTRQHILGLNSKANRNKIRLVRDRLEGSKTQ
jgi:hypothetical protein